MYDLVFHESFEKSFSKIADKQTRQQIWKKILELEEYAPRGKHLVGNPYWTLRVGGHRVIYLFHPALRVIRIVDILERKHQYRELR